MAKILYSPGYGAGWSSWCHNNSNKQEEFMLRYPPLIDALEAGEDIGYDESIDPLKPFKPGSVLERFYNDFIEKFGAENTPYMGGARDLCVVSVDGPFRINEYDGNESVVSFSPESYHDPITWDDIIEGGECVEEVPQIGPGKDIEI